MRSAVAAADVAPRRLVIFPIANGVTQYSDIATPGATPEEFSFGQMTAPLEAQGLKSQTVVIDNLEFKQPDGDVDTHYLGLVQLLTGVFPPDWQNGRSKNVSIDQYLGAKLGGGRPFAPLAMGTMCDSLSYSYNAKGDSSPSDSNPRNVYDRFSELFAPGDRGRVSRRQSVLRTVAADLGAFQRQLGADHRARADAQLAAVRTLEKNLGLSLQPNGTCGLPTLAERRKIDYKSDQFVPETMRAFIDLAVATMACDLTRVVLLHSYLREYHPPWFKCPWKPANAPDYDFHSLSHDFTKDNYASFVRAKAFHFELAGELALKLSLIPEYGGSMLDHTIIFIPTEIGKGHQNWNLQFLTIGGGGLGVRTGRYLRSGSNGRGNGTPHQRLLVALLNAMGLPDTTFGDKPGTGSGPLDGYLRG